MDQRQRRHRILSWLLYLPSLEKVARSIVLDYLSVFQPIQATIYHLNQDDSLLCVAAYGTDNPTVGTTIASTSWRDESEATTLAIKATHNNSITWSDESRRAVINLYVQGILVGFMVLRFGNSVLYVEDFNEEASEISWYVSLYLAVHTHSGRKVDEVGKTGDTHITGDGLANNNRLSERQSRVLAGIVAGKTNNAIANDLGYSVSTIRHETMRIFQSLGVSDRVEAASHAKHLGLV